MQRGIQWTKLYNYMSLSYLMVTDVKDYVTVTTKPVMRLQDADF